ncbi:MAG: 5-formyltetrahydrofolate cyclo-ligase [Azovibrio sp.]|nr:5-formyltetrahydrofolate cyclo-ligase [Azovibrio sp.]
MDSKREDTTPPPSRCPPDRDALRRDMVAARRALPAATVAAWSAQIVAHLLARFARPPGACVAFCWPIQHEPDVRAALAAWARQGSRAALPVVIAPGKPLGFRPWARDTRLEPDRYGIPTPVTGPWVRPDALLLPLNAFDAAGYRLGYGGGFFDRTLASLDPRPLAIGVGFELNRVESIGPQAHDQPLDWIVTEAGCFRPR